MRVHMILIEISDMRVVNDDFLVEGGFQGQFKERSRRAEGA
ncbi:hypothetical protein OROMI_014346 [Orobanche minor]